MKKVFVRASPNCSLAAHLLDPFMTTFLVLDIRNDEEDEVLILLNIDRAVGVVATVHGLGSSSWIDCGLG